MSPALYKQKKNNEKKNFAHIVDLIFLGVDHFKQKLNQFGPSVKVNRYFLQRRNETDILEYLKKRKKEKKN